MPTKSSIERLPKSRVVAMLVLSTEEIASGEKAALHELGKSVKLEGFRPGHVPPEVLKEKIEPGALLEETVRAVLPQVLPPVLKEHSVKPIIPPKVELESREPFTLRITFVEQPEVTLKGADKITIEKTPLKTDAADVQKMIDYVMSQHRTATEVDRAARKKDQVMIDFWGADAAGQPIEKIKSEGYSVIIGSSSLIPGFEEELIGLKKGEKKSFTLTFPKEYHAEEMRGKPVTFWVTVQKVEELKNPELTDSFVKEHFEAPSVEEFKSRIEQSLKMEEERAERGRREQQLLEAIRKATHVDLPDELIDEEAHQLLLSIEEQLKEQNLTIKDWLERTKKTPEQVRDDMRRQATDRITLRLGVQKLIGEKQITVSDEDMKTLTSLMVAQTPEADRARRTKELQPGTDAHEQLRWQRTVEKLMEQMLAA